MDYINALLKAVRQTQPVDAPRLDMAFYSNNIGYEIAWIPIAKGLLTQGLLKREEGRISITEKGIEYLTDPDSFHNIEFKRIINNNQAEVPQALKISFSIPADLRKPDEILVNAKDIMLAVSQFAYSADWPADEEWKSILPGWFVKTMISATSKDREEDPQLWHFESWIAAMKDRAWLWYSSGKTKDAAVIVIEALCIPVLYDPLLNIFYSLGIPFEKIFITDEVYDTE